MQKKQPGHVAVLLALLIAAPPASARPTPSPNAGLTVVLPSAAGGTAVGIPADEFWTPTAADVRWLEATLKARPPAAVGGYYRQYLGVVRSGMRLIYVNGFSPVVVSEFGGPRGSWRRRFVFVDDGGTDFFHMYYDPKTRRFSGFQFNGVG